MTENPFRSPMSTSSGADKKGEPLSSARATYNVMADTVTGVNVRWSDNKFQAMFVFASVVLLSLLGAMIAALNPQWQLPWFGGAVIGTFAGLVVGVFASGIFLMFYRGARHFKGKHD